MNKVISVILLLIWTLAGQAQGESDEFVKSGIVLGGTKFIVRNIDAFDDVSYLNINDSLRNYEICSYNKGRVFISSPINGWGYFFLNGDDTITFKESGHMLNATSERRTSEVIFFHTLFAKHGNYSNLYNGVFLKTIKTLQSLRDTINDLFRSYSTYLEDYAQRNNWDKYILNQYKDHLNFAQSNLLSFATIKYKKEITAGQLADFMKELSRLLQKEQWDDPEYKKMIRNFVSLKQLAPADNQGLLSGLGFRQKEYYIFSCKKEQILSNETNTVIHSNDTLDNNSKYGDYIKNISYKLPENKIAKAGESYLHDGLLSTDTRQGNLFEVMAASLKDYFLLDFWASWCGPCRLSIPDVVKAVKNASDINIEVIFLSTDNNTEAWKNAIKMEKLTDKLNFIFGNFSASAIREKFKIVAVPRYMLVHRSGRVLSTALSSPESQAFGLELRKLIAQDIN